MKDFEEAFPTPDTLNDEGCRKLMAAILLQSATDFEQMYEHPISYPLKPGEVSIPDLDSFFKSEWYKTLASEVLPIPAEEFRKRAIQFHLRGHNIGRFIKRWMRNLEDQDKEDNVYYEPSMLRNLLNNPSYGANHKPKEEI